MAAKQGPQLCVRATTFDHPKCDVDAFVSQLALVSTMHVLHPLLTLGTFAPRRTL